MNRSPHSSVDFKILEEVWLDDPINNSILRIFGFVAYAYVNDGKLAPRVIKCVFLSYASESNGNCL